MPAESVEKIFYPKCVVFNDNKRKEEGGGVETEKKREFSFMVWNAARITCLAFAFLFLKLLVVFVFSQLHSWSYCILVQFYSQKKILFLGIYFTWDFGLMTRYITRQKSMHVLSVLG